MAPTLCVLAMDAVSTLAKRMRVWIEVLTNDKSRVGVVRTGDDLPDLVVVL